MLGQIIDAPNRLHQVERALIFVVSSPLKRVLLKKIFVDVENVEKPLRGSCHEVAGVNVLRSVDWMNPLWSILGS